MREMKCQRFLRFSFVQLTMKEGSTSLASEIASSASFLYEFVCRDPSYPCCRRIRLALSIEVGYLPGLLSNSKTMPSPTHPLALGRSGGRRGRAMSSQPTTGDSERA